MVETKDATREAQLVAFNLGNEIYGVDIAGVREIIRMQAVTQVPRAPDFVEGVINLRGKVIPVIDLRKRLGLPLKSLTREARISVVEIDRQHIGLIVDGVSEVLRIPAESVEPPSAVITTVDSDYLRGIAKLNERLIILLDIERVLSRKETRLLQDIAAEQRGSAPAR